MRFGLTLISACTDSEPSSNGIVTIKSGGGPYPVSKPSLQWIKVSSRSNIKVFFL